MVEERLEQDGRDERHEEDEQRERSGGRKRPPAWEPAHEPDRRDPDGGGQHELDHLAFDPIREPAAQALGREAEPALADEAAPNVQGQARHADRCEHEHGPEGSGREPVQSSERKTRERAEDRQDDE